MWEAWAVMFAAGLTRGLAFPGTTKAILDWFPPSGRATAMGFKQCGMPVAGIVAASILPTIGLALGWRLAVAMAGFLVIAAGAITAIFYRDPPSAGRRRDVRASMRAGMADVIRNRRLWVLSAIAAVLVAVQMGLLAYLALYFKEILLVEWVPEERTRIVAAGGYLALCQVGGMFGRVLWGVASDRVFHGRRTVVMALAAAMTSLASLAMGVLRPDYPLWVLMGAVFVLGASGVGWNGVYHALIPETAGRRFAATGVGFSMTLTQIGNVSGPPMFGFVVDLTGSYQPAWFLFGFLCAVGSLASLLAAKGEKQVV